MNVLIAPTNLWHLLLVKSFDFFNGIRETVWSGNAKVVLGVWATKLVSFSVFPVRLPTFNVQKRI